MALRIETFSAVKGGNSFFKAVTHPHVVPLAAALVARLEAAGPVAVYDPAGFTEGFAEFHDLSGVEMYSAVCHTHCSRVEANFHISRSHFSERECPKRW